MNDSEEYELWREGLQTRLSKATRLLKSDKQLSSTQRNSCLMFKQLIAANETFASEVKKLNQLNFELLSISLNKGNLDKDRKYFTAAEMKETLGFNIQKKRREEVKKFLRANAEDPATIATNAAYEARGGKVNQDIYSPCKTNRSRRCRPC